MLTAALDERRILLEKQSIELKEQNDKIVKANEELKLLNETTNRQKDEIISSILYAQRIQSAILPPETYVTELLNENFIFYKPKDIVSGDFYWIKQVKHYVHISFRGLYRTWSARRIYEYAWDKSSERNCTKEGDYSGKPGIE